MIIDEQHQQPELLVRAWSNGAAGCVQADVGRNLAAPEEIQ